MQQYYGTFGFLPSFESANANYSDHTVADLPGQASRMLHAQLQPLVQLQVGPIAFVGQVQLDYWVRPDRLAYDSTLDTLLPDAGWTAAADVDLLYVRPRFAIGARFSHVHPFYTERHFIDAADRAAYDGDNMQSRLGMLAAYTLRDRGPLVARRWQPRRLHEPRGAVRAGGLCVRVGLLGCEVNGTRVLAQPLA